MTVATNEETILLVDDNKPYREAVKRNLEFIGYTVEEAEDLDSALAQLRRSRPMLIITDLDMRTHTEGLDLIRVVKEQYSRIPIILISAVGTFDEGALARQLGALYVISKSRIDEEIENLYQCLDNAKSMLRRIRNLRERVEAYVLGDNKNYKEEILRDLELAIGDPDVDIGLKSDVFELMNLMQGAERESEVKAELERISASAPDQQGSSQNVEQELRALLPSFDELHEESQSMLKTAEVFKRLEENDSTLSFSRNVSFSYCFAVENEIKQRIGKKIFRFMSSSEYLKSVRQLYDKVLRNLNLHFTQYITINKNSKHEDLSLDIIRQVLERMMKHGERYKPDGLKALGVVLFCFAREYSFKAGKKQTNISNPLGLKGLSDDEVLDLANGLIRLQHLRNPYIHPEFSEREKTDRLREVTLFTMELTSRLT